MKVLCTINFERMDILVVEIEFMGMRHKLRVNADEYTEEPWHAKLLDESNTVIQRFESEKIGFGFSKMAKYLLTCGKIIRIHSMTPECAPYSTLLMRSIVMRERKSRPLRQYLVV